MVKPFVRNGYCEYKSLPILIVGDGSFSLEGEKVKIDLLANLLENMCNIITTKH